MNRIKSKQVIATSKNSGQWQSQKSAFLGEKGLIFEVTA
jgi:hypothetical protein